ncbi:uncharacterized protein Dwil_GK17212 [Drosophila willistoni]|uniref:Uncharacterized protein n=1 Tax=Drosophila willistoni TaxID=7260 RepID=B4MLG4_DROWI|nr:uncharacterized protein Dwil_GK17212 [Drosophila willistoni]
MEHILNEVKGNVQKKFNEIRAALHMREKLLLRQLEVIANTQKQQQMLKPGRRGGGGGGDGASDADGDIQFITGDGDEEDKLLAAIRTFGHFQLDNNNMQFALQDYRNTGLRNEDYIEPIDDHETMYKCLQERNIAYAYDLDVDDVHDVDGDEEAAPPNAEAIVVDFTNKSLIEENNINAKRSIINITLQEAKELVRKAKIKRDSAVVVPPLNLEELDDELESSIAEAVSSLGRDGRDSSRSKSSTLLEHGKPPPASTQKQSQQQQQRKPRFKPKITINNCNGTINLRNIASLTINCAQEEAVSTKIPLAKPPQSISADSSSSSTTTTTNTNTNTTDQSISTASSSSYSSNASSRSQSKKQKSNNTRKSTQAIPASNQHEVEAAAEEAASTNSNSYQFEEVVVEQDTHDVTCDFYNRLLDEIKKSMKEKPRRIYATTAPADSTCNANTQPTKKTGTTTTTNKDRDNEDDASELPSSMSSHLQPGKRLILKNFENLKIILEANSGDEDSFHPVQIEQWLAEIISETDLEPMQNTDILEHSQIHSSESN